MPPRNTSVNITIAQVASQNKSTINYMGYNALNNITSRGRKQVSCAPPLLQNVTIRNKVHNYEMSNTSKNIEQLPGTCVGNVNLGDGSNPDLVSDYVVEIYSHLGELETRDIIKPGFLKGHRVTPSMRAVLVDWLVQVHVHFSLLQETFQLTIGLLDRVLQADKSVTRNDLQLLGITAALIASKFEEVCPPDLEDLVNLTAGRYSNAEVKQMELRVLSTLAWNVSFPQPIHFLRRYSKVCQATAQHHTLAKFLVDLSLQEYSLCHHQPSILAAAALHLSQRILLGNTKWSPIIRQYMGYTEESLKPLVGQLASVLDSSPSSNLMAIRDKYRFNSYFNFSKINYNIVKRITTKHNDIL